MSVTIVLKGFDANKTINRLVDNPRVGIKMAETTAKFMRKYVPEDSGTLADSYITRPWEIHYLQTYAHYMFNGKVYGPNLPITKGGAVLGWYSIKNATKYPTGKPLQYTKPLATAHWDRPTQANCSVAIAQEMTNFIKGGF